jgi:hypothetical protein
MTTILMLLKQAFLQSNPYVDAFSTRIRVDPISKAGDQDVQAQRSVASHTIHCCKSTLKSYGYLVCPAIVAMKANKGDTHISSKVHFDSDSKRILIDICASYSISHDKEDFVRDLQPVKRQIKGIGGTLGFKRAPSYGGLRMIMVVPIK